jgi:hypothetical protein
VRPAPTRPAKPRISPGRTSKLASCAQPGTLKAHAHGRRVGGHHQVARRVQVGQFAAHHQVGHLLARDVGRGRAGDEAAVAHHDHFVGHLLHFVELVRDVDDGHAIGAQLRDQLEQALGLAGRERGGGLVHDQQARAAGDGLGDLDQLLLGDDELAHLGARIDLQADGRDRGGRIALHRRVVEQPALFLLVAEEDVLRDGQVFGEVELLVDQHDAQRFGIARAA